MPESPPAPNVLRYLPVIVIALVALLGVILLRDELTFDALARHRETLLAFRDAHYVWAALAFMLTYCLLVTFSLPRAGGREIGLPRNSTAPPGGSRG